jgi:hypothetical protein
MPQSKHTISKVVTSPNKNKMIRVISIMEETITVIDSAYAQLLFFY